MDNFALWLRTTPLSSAINSQDWIVPLAQTIHIGALAVCAFSAVLWVVSLAGMLGATFSQALRQLLPKFFWSSLVVLLVTGGTLILSEPGRELLAVSFWLKMALVAGLAGVLWYWQSRQVLLHKRHVVAVAATFIAVIFFGRMIAVDATLWNLNG